MATLRDRVAPDLARQLEAQIRTLAPPTMLPLEQLKNLVRARESLPEVSLRGQLGESLGRYLYWSMCREAIGEQNGVPLSWIMDLFRCQKAQFSKLIGEVSVPHPCPCCAAMGLATSVRAGPPHRLESAHYHCQACGHTEVFGIDHPNQLACPCPACKTQVVAALSEASTLALGIAERLVEGASRNAKERHFGRLETGGMRENIAMNYAQLRMIGKSPEECAHILFEGTIYGGSTFGDEWPRWAVDAVQAKILVQLAVETLQGDDAKHFARESLTLLIAEGAEPNARSLTLADVEEQLGSASGEVFAHGIKLLKKMLRGNFLLPQRRKCQENAHSIANLADEANETGVEPAHVARDQHWYEKIKRTAFTPRLTPAWKG